ncbi:hypothetical protein MATL_G00184520 [Megalops atlanticus]|uniref:Uncharacterized protein n=1 Tax=Megalops atlanticus TaxID=7932 RepID=A0A9D3PK72_MEGAT|nr:hypothetical protein MATL_G00184520 [Megalops atlanticus]
MNSKDLVSAGAICGFTLPPRFGSRAATTPRGIRARNEPIDPKPHQSPDFRRQRAGTDHAGGAATRSYRVADVADGVSQEESPRTPFLATGDPYHTIATVWELALWQ